MTYTYQGRSQYDWLELYHSSGPATMSRAVAFLAIGLFDNDGIDVLAVHAEEDDAYIGIVRFEVLIDKDFTKATAGRANLALQSELPAAVQFTLKMRNVVELTNDRPSGPHIEIQGSDAFVCNTYFLSTVWMTWDEVLQAAAHGFDIRHRGKSISLAQACVLLNK